MSETAHVAAGGRASRERAERLVEARQLLATLSQLPPSFDEILSLRNTRAALESLLGRIKNDRQNARLIRVLDSRMGTAAEQVRNLYTRLANYLYPFEHAGESLSIAQHLLAGLPDRKDLAAVLNASGGLLSNYVTLLTRVLGRLVVTAEAMETALGLQPLPEPAKPGDAATA